MVEVLDSQTIVESQQDKLLTLMIWFGVFLATICTFLFHPIHYVLLMLRVDLRPWELWELGALIWTMLFLIYYFTTFPLPHKDDALKRIILCWFAILGFSFVAVLSLVITSLGPSNLSFLLSTALERMICYVHIFCVLGVVFFIMAIDKLLAKWHEESEDRLAFRESYLLTGVPSVGAYVILMVYVLMDWLVDCLKSNST